MLASLWLNEVISVYSLTLLDVRESLSLIHPLVSVSAGICVVIFKGVHHESLIKNSFFVYNLVHFGKTEFVWIDP